MKEIPFGEYRPDNADLNSKFSSSILNALPRSDGWGPFKDYSGFTDALPATCRGYFYARRRDGSVAIFAGTVDKLYLLDNTDFSWTDVSASSGTYTDLNSQAQWQFVQFNDNVIAVQANAVPQVFDLTSDTEFSALSGSPPQAAYISVINRFIVLSGLSSQPYRVQWSGLNAITTWTAGTNFSDFQDLPDGGIVRGVAGGEYGLIMQDQSIRRMIYSPGSDLVFQIDRIAQDRGLLAPYSLIPAGERLFFYSAQGFVQTDASGQLQMIGKEFVDREFLRDFDFENLQLLIGAADPKSNIVAWGYRSVDDSETESFNKLLIYDWSLQRWGRIEMRGHYITSLSKPGLTLENLDDISASIEDLPFSLDEVSTATLPSLSLAGEDGKIGFFSGDNLTATLETAEFSDPPYRLDINGVTPITDANNATVAIASRDTLAQDDAPVYGSESALNEDGFCPLLEEGRYVRARVKIPAGAVWSFARGIIPDFMRGSQL